VAPVALTNAFAYVAGHDFTGDTNEVRLNCEAAALDKTTFRSQGWTEHALGLKSSTFAVNGFWQSASADSVDSEAFPDLGVANRVVTFADVETAGLPAYMAQVGKFSYSTFGQLGELAPFELGCSGTDGVGIVRGYLAKAAGTVSATGALGSSLNLGLIGAGQYLYATFHVLGTPGTTITAVVESDEDDTWSSATTRITFGPITTAGGTWGTRVAGAIASDDWFRVRVTAITGTFTVAAAIGIQ
jgi:hypothetical protein